MSPRLGKSDAVISQLFCHGAGHSATDLDLGTVELVERDGEEMHCIFPNADIMIPETQANSYKHSKPVQTLTAMA